MLLVRKQYVGDPSGQLDIYVQEQIITNLLSGVPFSNIIIDQGEIQVPLLNHQ